MPTIVDSLVLELGLDPNDFIKGEKEVDDALSKSRTKATKGLKEVGSAAQRANDVVGTLQRQLLGAITAFVGFSAAKSFVTDTTAALTSLGRMAQLTGAKTKEVAEFAQAVERNGGNAGAATEEVNGLISAWQRFKTLGDASPELKMFAGTIGAGANDTWKDMLKRFSEFAEKNKADPALVTQIGKMGGLSEQSISELMKGPEQFEKDLEKSRQLGAPSDKDVKAAQELTEAFGALSQAANTFGRDLLTELEPAIKSATEAVTSWMSDKRGPEGAGAGALAGAIIGFLIGGPAGAAAGAAIGGSLGALAGGAGVIGEKLDTPEIEQSMQYDPMTGMPLPGTAAAAPKPKEAKKPPADSKGDVDKLMSMGWTREQATGMAANLQRESGGDAQAVGDNGNAYGLAQWHPDRQANFAKWAGHDMRKSSRDEQLEFMNYELRQGSEQKAGAALSAAKDAADAARIVSQQYERPADQTGEAAARAALATAMLKSPTVPNVLTGAAGSAEYKDVTNNNQAPTSNSTSTVAINGPINIQTQATDAQGIASDLRGHLENYDLIASQANRGLK